MIEENLKNLFKEIPEYNPFGEKVTIVGAVKFQTAESINRAVRAGLTDIGDNHVQEFREKFDLIEGSPRRHFIGHLQTNKIKYLVGKVDLYHSVDSVAGKYRKRAFERRFRARRNRKSLRTNKKTARAENTRTYGYASPYRRRSVAWRACRTYARGIRQD